jgi:hypothetical protein
MAWLPESTDLGSVNEIVSFSNTITYEQEDPGTMTMVSYPVTITVNQVNPNTISVSGGILSGYYFDSFDNTITYRTSEGSFPVVTKFNQINIDQLYEMISYKASLVSSKTFTYTATAKDGDTIIATQVYSKTVTNDWTSGKNSLQEYVGYASSK